MLMKNTSTNTIRIPSNMTVGWTGRSDATVAIPPGGIVDITNAYACRQRVVHSADSNPMIMPSTAERLTAMWDEKGERQLGAALKPHGREANELYKLFADELPEVIAEHAKHLAGEMGVAASVDAKAEAAKREAMEIGFRTMAATGRLRNESRPVQTPRVYSEEELPPE